MPVAFGPPAPGSLGKCGKHRTALLPEPREDLAEKLATERAAEEARTMLAELSLSEPPAETLRIKRRVRTRRGYCPKCIEEVAAEAVAFLNGDNL